MIPMQHLHKRLSIGRQSHPSGSTVGDTLNHWHPAAVQSSMGGNALNNHRHAVPPSCTHTQGPQCSHRQDAWLCATSTSRRRLATASLLMGNRLSRVGCKHKSVGSVSCGHHATQTSSNCNHHPSEGSFVWKTLVGQAHSLCNSRSRDHRRATHMSSMSQDRLHRCVRCSTAICTTCTRTSGASYRNAGSVGNLSRRKHISMSMLAPSLKPGSPRSHRKFGTHQAQQQITGALKACSSLLASRTAAGWPGRPVNSSMHASHARLRCNDRAVSKGRAPALLASREVADTTQYFMRSPISLPSLVGQHARSTVGRSSSTTGAGSTAATSSAGAQEGEGYVHRIGALPAGRAAHARVGSESMQADATTGPSIGDMRSSVNRSVQQHSMLGVGGGAVRQHEEQSTAVAGMGASPRHVLQDEPHRTLADGVGMGPRYEERSTGVAGMGASSQYEAQGSFVDGGVGMGPGPEVPDEAVVENDFMEEVDTSQFVEIAADSFLGSKSVIDAVMGERINTAALEKVEVIRINMTMVQLGQTGQLKPITRLMQYMLDQGIANSHSFASAVCAYSAAGRLDLALSSWESWYQQGIDVGPVGASALVKVCGEHDEVQLALEVFNKLVERKVSMNRFSWNCIIMLCIEAGLMEPAMEIFTVMRAEASEDCWPDTYTYGLMLNGVVRSRKWGLGATLYQCLQEDGIVPDPQVWCHLITIAARMLDTDCALKYFNRMLEVGLRPTLRTYNALLHAFGKMGDFDAAWAHYQKLLVAGIWPDEVTFTSLLTAASRSAQPLPVLNMLLLEMDRHDVPVNKFVGSALMNAYRCCHQRHPDSADECLDRACRLLPKLLDMHAASAHSYACIIQMAAHQGYTPMVLSLLQEMESVGLNPSYKTYSILLQTCSELGLEQLVTDLRNRRAELAGVRALRPGMGGNRTGGGVAPRHKRMSGYGAGQQ